MTAAGSAGGALVFEGMQSMFGHRDAATIAGNQAALPGLGEAVLNERWGPVPPIHSREASADDDPDLDAGRKGH
jgi:hypothetical protein